MKYQQESGISFRSIIMFNRLNLLHNKYKVLQKLESFIKFWVTEAIHKTKETKL